MSLNILVGDIGSTKSTWWSNTGGNSEFLLSGYNPVVHDPEVGRRMLDQLWHVTEGSPFSKIWYYGTGVVDEKVSDTVKAEIRRLFPVAEIKVQSDLLGAVIAACGVNEGTVAILGTGSHAAVFDGQKIVRQASGLGYVLGDEGSGCDIGKSLIRAYFYQYMPEEMASAMHNLIPGGRSEFLQQLYHHDMPNQFLADFVKVAVEHSSHRWIENLVVERFLMFIRLHILPLHPPGPIHVVGSIGTIFADLFRQSLEKHHLQAGEFIKDPAKRLFETHLQHE